MGVVHFATERRARRPEPPDLISSCRECGDPSTHVVFPRIAVVQVERMPLPYGLCACHAEAAERKLAHG